MASQDSADNALVHYDPSVYQGYKGPSLSPDEDARSALVTRLQIITCPRCTSKRFVQPMHCAAWWKASCARQSPTHPFALLDSILIQRGTHVLKNWGMLQADVLQSLLDCGAVVVLYARQRPRANQTTARSQG